VLFAQVGVLLAFLKKGRKMSKVDKEALEELIEKSGVGKKTAASLRKANDGDEEKTPKRGGAASPGEKKFSLF
jgi:hypothetical protein